MYVHNACVYVYNACEYVPNACVYVHNASVYVHVCGVSFLHQFHVVRLHCLLSLLGFHYVV